MKKTVFLIMLVSILSSALGLVRDLVLSYFYGASSISDVFIIATYIPGIMILFLITGIATSFIPMYSNIEQQSSVKQADEFTSNVINLVLVICSFIIVLVLLFTTPIVRLFASGFEGETLALAVQFTRISIFGVYFSSIVYIFKSYLQNKSSFVIIAAISLPLNMIMIPIIVLSTKYNVILLAYGNFLAIIAQLIILFPSIQRQRYKYRLILNIKDKNLSKMLSLSLFSSIGASVTQINTMVDRTMASRIVEGGISALNYADKLNFFIQGIVVTSVVTVLYPFITKKVTDNDMIGLKKSVAEAINTVSLLIIPASVGAMFFSYPIVELLFGRGQFDSIAISMTSSALFFYSIGMIGYGLREILSRVFYSFQDTKTPMINSAIAVVLNIVLILLLSPYLGVGGIALATSISAITCTILMFFSLIKKIGPIGMKNIIISFVKILSASIIMGVLAFFSFTLLIKFISLFFSFLISVLLGIIIYLILIYILKIEDAVLLVKLIKGKFRRSPA